MLNADHKGTLIENLAEFNRDHSPTIPHAFPKDRLPTDLCQHLMADWVSCLMGA